LWYNIAVGRGDYMYSLYIDTHDKNVVVVLYKNGLVIDLEDIVSINNKHSQIVLPTIDSILNRNKLDVSELNEILVVNGPGSFTGERIAVTIAKTIAYALNIPIKAIDSLTVKAINIEGDKIVANEDRNGAFVASFDKNNKIVDEIKYFSNMLYNDFKKENKVIVDVEIDYNKVYEYMKSIKDDIPHNVKPLYVKGITGLNDK